MRPSDVAMAHNFRLVRYWKVSGVPCPAIGFYARLSYWQESSQLYYASEMEHTAATQPLTTLVLGCTHGTEIV